MEKLRKEVKELKWSMSVPMLFFIPLVIFWLSMP